MVLLGKFLKLNFWTILKLLDLKLQVSKLEAGILKMKSILKYISGFKLVLENLESPAFTQSHPVI